MKEKNKKFILWFEEIGIEDVSLVGGKNASLGEMIQNLTPLGIKIPKGFAVTAAAYFYFLKSSGLFEKLKNILADLNVKDVNDLSKRAKAVRLEILNTSLPKDLEEEIKENYLKLCQKLKKENLEVAVRSSSTSEDLPTASFAGINETYLNISGAHNVIEAVKRCFASLFTERAISYRVDKGFDHFKVGLSVGIQKMVRSDLGSSGVMFTLDTESGFKNVIYLTSIWGLGETIVQGRVEPDEFYVFKPSLKQGYKPIIYKKIGSKDKKTVYSHHGFKTTKEVAVDLKDRSVFSLTDKEVLTLAKWGMLIEEHYSKKNKRLMPMDIEWAKDGQTKELFIVQARPETVHLGKDFKTYEIYKLKSKGKLLLKGLAVGEKITSGLVRLIKDVSKIGEFQAGEILVTQMTDPDWEPIMKIAGGIITNEGGRTCFSGETKILTNKGYFSFKEIYQKVNSGEEFLIFSYDYLSKKPVWKKVLSVQKNNLPAIRVSISQTGRMENNFIDVTPDHQFYTYKKRQLVKKPLKEILEDKEAICLVDSLPSINKKEIERDRKLAYLLGALATDGNVYLYQGVNQFRRGQITFTQKNSFEKKDFISTVNSYFNELFNQPLIPQEKTSTSLLRGRIITGAATDYRCFNLSLSLKIHQLLNDLPLLALSFSEKEAMNFLAGVIDGDGSFYHNRIQIYLSKQNILEAVIISCLRLGIIPQVTTNRNIFNVQILERMSEILCYAKKIKIQPRTKFLGTKLFAAKQLFEDVIDKLNYKGRIKPYLKNNLLLDSRKIRSYLLPLARKKLKKELIEILGSSLRMQRIKFIKNLGKIEVFNIEVEADSELNHNYVVFTKRLSPLLVSNSHAAIVSRELGVPAIVGADKATQILKTGQLITMDCSTGSEGFVYEGALKWEKEKISLASLPQTKTKVMLNIGNPEAAFSYSHLPVDGVGLLRIEFVAASVKIHPLALIHFKNLKDKKLKETIEKLTAGYADKKEFFVEKLAEGVGRIAAAFWPKEVIMRFSDFKTNEYKSLIGGELFEPEEANPMLGWRGASRYYHLKYQPAFELELKAVKKVREEFGLKNLNVMVPFCRTPEEGKKVMDILIKNGLRPSKDGLKVYVMCEIPSNVILAEEFLKIFDGFSIGSNDLTQLILGIDRDNANLINIADERQEAVKKMLFQAIKIAKSKNKYVGICGQAPSDFPEIVEFLVKAHIDSVSLNPDTVIKTKINIAKIEKKMKNG